MGLLLQIYRNTKLLALLDLFTQKTKYSKFNVANKTRNPNLSKLPYLEVVIKGTLGFAYPFSFLIPSCPDYTIFKGVQVVLEVLSCVETFGKIL